MGDLESKVRIDWTKDVNERLFRLIVFLLLFFPLLHLLMYQPNTNKSTVQGLASAIPATKNLSSKFSLCPEAGYRYRTPRQNFLLRTLDFDTGRCVFQTIFCVHLYCVR